MKLEDQVCSLELAKRLKELGVAQQQSLYRYSAYYYKGETLWKLCDRSEVAWIDSVDAFTVAELGEMLPEKYRSFWHNPNHRWWVCGKESEIGEDASTESDARAKMLIYLIEKGIVTTNAKGEGNEND